MLLILPLSLPLLLLLHLLLFKDIQVNAEGQSSCNMGTCAASPTAEVVEAFAASNDAWISEFTPVFTKMLAHGASNLQDLS